MKIDMYGYELIHKEPINTSKGDIITEEIANAKYQEMINYFNKFNIEHLHITNKNVKIESLTGEIIIIRVNFDGNQWNTHAEAGNKFSSENNPSLSIYSEEEDA